MDILILHHHMNPGGVTRVIQSQILSMKENPDWKTQLFIGSYQMQVDESCTVTEIPSLNYLDADLDDDAYRSKFDELVKTLESKIPGDSIVHVHNMNLGKNPLLSLALHRLNKKGLRLVNHCHDFAEDGRPKNMAFLKHIIEGIFGEDLDRVLYANEGLIQYATLTRRDYNFLITKNIDANRVQVLPNPIGLSKPSPKLPTKRELLDKLEIKSEKPCIVYPVRVIKRKNIGEFILLASLFQEELHWMVTLAPQNPEEIVEYRKWTSFCQEENIPCHFEVGEKLEFEEVMHLADKVISTSIKEGFGMQFMEPWLFSKAMVGRDLPDITVDFRDSGITYPASYTKISLMKSHGKDYDFGFLDANEQRNLIREIKASSEKRKDLIEENQLDELLKDCPQELIAKNQELIKEHFSFAAYSRRLNDIYAKLS